MTSTTAPKRTYNLKYLNSLLNQSEQEICYRYIIDEDTIDYDEDSFTEEFNRCAKQKKQDGSYVYPRIHEIIGTYCMGYFFTYMLYAMLDSLQVMGDYNLNIDAVLTDLEKVLSDNEVEIQRIKVYDCQKEHEEEPTPFMEDITNLIYRELIIAKAIAYLLPPDVID